ncbi:MAG TPA: sodium:proton antiporter [Casimicrobiaceae bacterium]|nr:sodium:proton antiporter [Casimicrobiaceae bacterium]
MPEVNGAALTLAWIAPFVGLLLSIAVLPLVASAFWQRHYGKTSLFWSLAFLIPFALLFGPSVTFHAVMHTLQAEYVPFMILLFALFTVTGGIHVKGNPHGTPALNTGILALGTVLASVMGTTGAAMLLIRPLLRANDARRHNAHVVIFFIFLVANIGGSLTPLGDPPLFLGFLKGVDFFWTTRTMIWPMLAAAVLLLVVFFAIDSWYFRRPGEARASPDPTPDSRVGIDGMLNLLILGPLILVAVIVSGFWNPGIAYSGYGMHIELQNVVRDLALLAIAWLSWRYTPIELREAHHFEWAPIVEVAKLFAGIFLTIIPVIAILRAGHEGAMAPLLALVTDEAGRPRDALYFWMAGGLSSFLDNAPTYLVFFNLAGGDPVALMGPLASTLTAISTGAVFMGANTYIGNAPNFMVKSIAQSRGVAMPGFFGYMLWSGCILLPTFALLTIVFFR